MQRWIFEHHGFDPGKVVLIDGFFELHSLFEQVDMSLELGPTGKPIGASNLKLGGGERPGAAGIEQVPGLVFQLAEIRAIGEDAHSVGWLVRHSELLSCKCPLFALRAERSFAKVWVKRGGLLPFPRTGCVLHAVPAYYNL